MPPPDWLAVTPASGQACLVTDDGSDVTLELVDRLTSAGQKVVVLQFPIVGSDNMRSAKPFSTEVTRITVEESSEAYLGEMLKAIARSVGRPSTFIHLHPSLSHLSGSFAEQSSDAQSPDVMFSAADSALVKQVFFMAKHLKRYFVAATDEEDSRCSFLTVARLNGAFGLAADTSSAPAEAFSPVAGGLFGLVKTLRAEWPTVFCRTIDLQPKVNPAVGADRILCELHDPDCALVEVSYREGQRYTLAAVPEATL